MKIELTVEDNERDTYEREYRSTNLPDTEPLTLVEA